MTKSDLKILERIFSAEIEGRLPAQFKSKHLARLQDEGYVEPMTRILAVRFPMRVSGWQLTHAGRIAYCESCGDNPAMSTQLEGREAID